MLFSRLLGLLRSGKSSRRAKQAEFYTPQLEGLEAREVPAVFTVTNVSGSEAVQNSLPWAVVQANYTSPGLDVINFNIPGGGNKVISLEKTMFLNDQVVIDAKTQPGYSGAPVVWVHGNSTNPGATPSLFQFVPEPNTGTTSTGSTIQGFGMYNFQTVAVSVFAGSTDNFIQDNYIGFQQNADGSVALNTAIHTPPNTFPLGIGIQSSKNTVRGNTISGVYNAIAIGEDPGGPWSGTQYVSNSLSTNNIGTDPTGQTAAGYGNIEDGFFLGHGAIENFLGPDNVLSGLGSAGIELLSSTNRGNVAFKNSIGTNRGNTFTIGNGQLGVLLANGATGNAIGGPFGGNVISGNALGGVALGTDQFPGAPGNWVQFNIMGLNGSQTAAIGSQLVGISVQDGASRNVIEGNVLSGHGQHGVVVRDARANGINGNWIGMNSAGAPFPNRANGVALLTGASFNFIQGNAFGPNGLGPIFVDTNAIGNAIG